MVPDPLFSLNDPYQNNMDPKLWCFGSRSGFGSRKREKKLKSVNKLNT